MVPLAVGEEEAPAEAPVSTPGNDAAALITLIAAHNTLPPAIQQGDPRAVAVDTPAAGATRPDIALVAMESRASAAAPVAPATGTAAATVATSLLLDPTGGAMASPNQGTQPLSPAASLSEPSIVAANLQTGLPPAVLAAGLGQPAEAVAETVGTVADATPTSVAENVPAGDARQAQRAATADATPALRMESTMTAPRWGEEMAQKIVWLAGRNESRAELVLTPPQLGKVEVTLTVSHSGETSALFVSPNAQVREALEHSLVRLREVFAAAGISLGQTSVSDDSPARDQGGEMRRGSRGRLEPIAPVALPIAAPASLHRGLVDTFV
jgi:flagellar hook-length control protein FliK